MQFTYGKSLRSKAQALRGFIDTIRPKHHRDHRSAEKKLKIYSQVLNDPLQAAEFSRLISGIALQADFTGLFLESGISSKNGFYSQIVEKIRDRFVPPVQDKNSLVYVINTVFYKRWDYKWMEKIDNDILVELFSKIKIDVETFDSQVKNEICNSLTILSYRIAHYGTDPEIAKRLGKRDELQTPFIEQNKEVVLFLEGLKQQRYDKETLNHLLIMLRQCEDNLEVIRKNSNDYGTSLYQNFILKQLEKLIRRVYVLIDFLDRDTTSDSFHFARFIKQIVMYENTKHSVWRFISSNAGVLSYQIAEHKGRTGEHYITSTRSEYWKFFISSCGGGFIVSLLVIIKTLLHHAHLPVFWESMAYSLNYAIGFVVIQVTGATLATKQPAMTASAIANSMDEKKGGQSSSTQLAILIAKVWRSQFISFTGNLLVVFPFALLWTFLFAQIFGHKLVEGAAAHKMLTDVHPLASAAWFYAALTGVFLFLSSVISGYVDNDILYRNLKQRIKDHPLLRKRFSPRRLDKIANYLDHNLGAIAGNVTLGFMLGTATFIGYVTALPYDIRHITFSTGNVAAALYGLDFHIKMEDAIMIVLGVIGIGFFNFIVSFGLALYVAIRSRKIDITQYAKLGQVVIMHFFRHPLDFLFPPKKEQE